MKLALLLTLALVACAFGYKTLEHNNGHDLLKELEAGNHNVYVIMFYVNATEGSTLANVNRDYEATLNSKVLDDNSNFYFTKVDAADKEYDVLIDELGLNVDELQKSPSVLIMEHSVGAWIHGPETISKIAEYAPVYKQRSQNK